MSLRAEQLNGSGGTPGEQNKQESGQEVRTQQHRKSEERRGMAQTEPEEERTEERLQPEGRQAEAVVPERDHRQVGLSPGFQVFPRGRCSPGAV